MRIRQKFRKRIRFIFRENLGFSKNVKSHVTMAAYHTYDAMVEILCGFMRF